MKKQYKNLQGWIYDPAGIEETMSRLPMPVFGDVAGSIKDSGKGKTVLLYKFLQQLTGGYDYTYQGTGDCVSWGAVCGADTLAATQIVLHKRFELWKGRSCTEIVYGGSRVQIGKNRLGNGQGSLGSWAAEWLSKFGSLLRGKYLGKYDFTTYNVNTALKYSTAGVPADLIDLIKEHPVKTVSQVRSVEQARDSIANGFPVTIAGNLGFSSYRDKFGFSARAGGWAHQMCLTGVDDAGVDGAPQGFLCENSWPKNWISGPKRLDQPDDSFWMRYEDAEQYFKYGDCWAYSNFEGYKPQKLDLRIV